MTNGLKKEDSAALKGLAVLLLIFHHCYRLADRIERYQVDLCGLTTEQLVAIAECCKICVAIFAFVSGYGLMYGYSAKMKNKEKAGGFVHLDKPAALFFCPYDKYNRTQLDL